MTNQTETAWYEVVGVLILMSFAFIGFLWVAYQIGEGVDYTLGQLHQVDELSADVSKLHEQLNYTQDKYCELAVKTAYKNGQCFHGQVITPDDRGETYRVFY